MNTNPFYADTLLSSDMLRILLLLLLYTIHDIKVAVYVDLKFWYRFFPQNLTTNMDNIPCDKISKYNPFSFKTNEFNVCKIQ